MAKILVLKTKGNALASVLLRKVWDRGNGSRKGSPWFWASAVTGCVTFGSVVVLASSLLPRTLPAQPLNEKGF